MAIATAAVTFDIADQLGNDFDPRRTKVWITTNIPGDTVIDKAGNKIRLGSGNVTLNADGTGSMLVWVPGADANPSSWQTTVHVDYPDRNAPKGRTTKSFGPFTITTNADLADLVAEMPVRPEFASGFLDLIQGYQDHAAVSGAVTINPAIGTHVLDATSATTLTFGSAGNGAIVTVLVTSGAANVSVTGLADAELVDGSFATFVRIRNIWVLAASGGSGGGAPVTDTTPPSSISGLTATGGSGQVSASWSASTDAESSVSYRWRVWLTSGGATGTWTTTTSTSMLKTGVAGGAYTLEVYAYSNGGATTTATATATVTTPVTYDIGDDFNSANTSSISGRTTTVGAKTWVTPWITGLGGSPLGITSNKLSDASGNGSARVLPAASNYTVKCTYDVTTSGSQVRIYARADGTNAEADGTASVGAVIRNNGDVSAERGNDYSIGTLGTGNPTTGTLALEVSGSTGRVLVNGVQVGATFSISAAVGTYAGIGIYSGGRADNFEVDYL